MTTVRPLCSTGITPLQHYYGPLRLPLTQFSRLCIPLIPSGYDPQVNGPPRFLADLSPRAVLKHPGELYRCIHWLLHGICWLHHLRQAGHSLVNFNEAESGSCALRLTALVAGASTVLLPNTAARLPTYTTNNLYGKLLSAYKISQAWPGAP